LILPTDQGVLAKSGIALGSQFTGLYAEDILCCLHNSLNSKAPYAIWNTCMSSDRFSPALRIAFWMSVTAVAFGVLMGLVRHTGEDMHVFVISFWRFVFGALVFLPWFLKVGAAGVKTGRAGLHVIRACFLIVSSVCLMSAVMLMPLDEATALSFTTPLFTVIGAILFLKEKAGIQRWAALIIGFVGMLIILRPGIEMVNWAAMLVMISAVTFAGVVLCGKVLTRTDSPELLVVSLAVVSVPLSFFPALFFWQWPTAEQFFYLVLIAIASNLNMYGIVKSLQIGDASATQPYDFLRLPTTAGVGWIAFGQTSDVLTWVGAAVIFGSTIFITRREALARQRALANSAEQD
jgi:drug/metabolite transporter (DMT)-like permease